MAIKVDYHWGAACYIVIKSLSGRVYTELARTKKLKDIAGFSRRAKKAFSNKGNHFLAGRAIRNKPVYLTRANNG